MDFFRQEYWSGLPLPSPGDLPNPGMKPGCPALHADALRSELPGKGTINLYLGKGRINLYLDSFKKDVLSF